VVDVLVQLSNSAGYANVTRDVAEAVVQQIKVEPDITPALAAHIKGEAEHMKAANLIRARRLVPPEESFSYFIDLRRMGSRTTLAFAGQGGVDGLLSVATPLGSFLLTKDSFALGLLFALFSLAAGIAAVVLGRVSDRVKVRSPFLLLGPVLSVPACLLAFVARDLGTFAFAIGWLSMTSVVAPSFIYTILVDRMEDSIPAVTATREFILNTSRTVALFAGLVVLAFGGDVYALYLLVGGVVLLEALAK